MLLQFVCYMSRKAQAWSVEDYYWQVVESLGAGAKWKIFRSLGTSPVRGVY